MHWGRDRVMIPLKVDPGIALATPIQEAQTLLGEWRYDDRASLPTAEEIERFTGGNPDDPTESVFRDH